MLQMWKDNQNVGGTGMTIKNQHIIHYVQGNRYLCNRACFTTKQKSTRHWKNVTCKNCLRRGYQ